MFKKIDNLIYKLDLLSNIHIHFIILITQLEFEINTNLYQKITLLSPSIKEINLDNPNLIIKYLLYKINTLLKRRNIEANNKYLIN